MGLDLCLIWFHKGYMGKLCKRGSESECVSHMINAPSTVAIANTPSASSTSQTLMGTTVTLIPCLCCSAKEHANHLQKFHQILYLSIQHSVCQSFHFYRVINWSACEISNLLLYLLSTYCVLHVMIGTMIGTYVKIWPQSTWIHSRRQLGVMSSQRGAHPLSCHHLQYTLLMEPS